MNGYGYAAVQAALQMRSLSSVVVVGGRVRPVEVLTLIASRLKLPGTGKV
jgi:hypothetical protein